MRRNRWIWGLVLAGLAATFAIVHVLGDESKAMAEPAVTINAPAVVALSGIPGSTTTDVVIAKPGSSEPPATVATFEHLPEAVIRGALVPSSQAIVVVADTLPLRERSWAASLLWIEPGAAPRHLVDRVYHASKPLVTQTGRVFVQRGAAGPIVADNFMRVDDLRVDEVDPASGNTRTLLQCKGYETHLAGALDNELIIYRVGPGGADLVAVDINTAAMRIIVPSWPSMARDFSIDETSRAVILQQLDPGPPRRWVVEHVDASTGKRSVLAASQHRDMVPYAWPDGGVLVNPSERRGPALLRSNVKVQKLDGPGVFWLRGTSPDQAWVTGSWSVPGSLPIGVVVRASDGATLRVPAREGHRVDVLGVKGGA